MRRFARFLYLVAGVVCFAEATGHMPSLGALVVAGVGGVFLYAFNEWTPHRDDSMDADP